MSGKVRWAIDIAATLFGTIASAVVLAVSTRRDVGVWPFLLLVGGLGTLAFGSLFFWSERRWSLNRRLRAVLAIAASAIAVPFGSGLVFAAMLVVGLWFLVTASTTPGRR